MKTLYLDIFSGLSGDMFVGALIDLGVDPGTLEQELLKLNLSGYHLHVARKHNASIEGVKFDVHLHDHGHEHDHEHEPEAGGHDHGEHGPEHAHGHSHNHPAEDSSIIRLEAQLEVRNYRQIKELLARSGLSAWVKEKAVAVFDRIAVAEGRIHGLPPEQVHFHEVGAVDSIIDIVAACVGLEALGKPRVLAAAAVEGTGWIQCAHGRLPIPVPATLQILGARGIPLTQCDEPHELITPTGAALLAEFAESFGPMRDLVAGRIGFGLGTRENQTRPNVLRAVLGETASAAASSNDWETDTIAVLETNLDDINAELLGHFAGKALAEGALAVFHTPIQMKKHRPGVLLTVLCAAAEADRFTELMLRETSAFGVRRSVSERRKLKRELVAVQTPFGGVTVKLGWLNGKVIQSAPEYESCKRAADAAGVSLKQVYEAALRPPE